MQFKVVNCRRTNPRAERNCRELLERLVKIGKAETRKKLLLLFPLIIKKASVEVRMRVSVILILSPSHH